MAAPREADRGARVLEAKLNPLGRRAARPTPGPPPVEDRYEAAARRLWASWGEWAGHTRCSRCAELRYCRARRSSRGPYLCLTCFDIGVEADHMIALLYRKEH